MRGWKEEEREEGNARRRKGDMWGWKEGERMKEREREGEIGWR